MRERVCFFDVTSIGDDGRGVPNEEIDTIFPAVSLPNLEKIKANKAIFNQGDDILLHI